MKLQDWVKSNTYLRFLRSIAVFLISFLAREDPGGTAYCIGERAGGGGAAAAIVVGGTSAGGGTGAGGAGADSGRGLGKMCFNLLFLWFFQKKNCCRCASSYAHYIVKNDQQ